MLTRIRAFIPWALCVVLACVGKAASADLFLRYLPPLPAQLADGTDPDTRTDPVAAASDEIRGNLDIYVAQGKVMLSGTSSTGREYRFWFEGEGQTFRVLDESGAGFFELTPSLFRSFDEGRQRLQRELATKLKKAPAEDHEKIILFTRGLERRLYGTRPSLSAYRPTGIQGRVGEYSCSWTEVIRHEMTVRELCLADAATLRIENADHEVLRTMHRAGEAIFAAADMGARLIPRIVLDLGHGIPIHNRYREPELARKRLTLQHVSRDTIPQKKIAGYEELKKFPSPITYPSY